MIRLSSFLYLIRQGFANIWRNRLMTLASIGVLVACMLLIGGAALLSVNVGSIVGYVEDQSEAVVFLDDGLNELEIADVENRIRATGNILTLDFVSKEQGLEDMMASIGDDGVLFATYEEEGYNNLPDSFRLTIDDVSRLTQTVNAIRQIEGVYSVNAPTDIADTITGLKNAVYVGGVVVVGILIVVSLMIIANTIKITVFSRRREINIMKYVGATDSFIRFPFLVEGLVLGILSAGIAYLLLWFGYDAFAEWVAAEPASWLQLIVNNLVPFSEVSAVLLYGFFAGGIAIGVLGSAVFVRKHLKV